MNDNKEFNSDNQQYEYYFEFSNIDYEDARFEFKSLKDFKDKINRILDGDVAINDAEENSGRVIKNEQIIVNQNSYRRVWIGYKSIIDKYFKGLIFTNHSFERDENEIECDYEIVMYLKNCKWEIPSQVVYSDGVFNYNAFYLLNYRQLQYYLYWRTCFENENQSITYDEGLLYLYINENYLNMRGDNPEDTYRYLETVFTSSRNLTGKSMLYPYRIAYDIGTDNNTANDINGYIIDIVEKNDYQNINTVLLKKSRYKIWNHAFVKNTALTESINTCIEICVNKINGLFESNGLKLSEFLIGLYNLRETLKDIYYPKCIWSNDLFYKLGIKTNYKIKELYEVPIFRGYIIDFLDGQYINTKQFGFVYRDDYLSSFILCCIEMRFKEFFNDNSITYPDLPHNYIKNNEENTYIEPLYERDKIKVSLYISLFEDIKDIVLSVVDTYIFDNIDLFEEKRIEYKKAFPFRTIPKEVAKSPFEFFMNNLYKEGFVPDFKDVYEKYSMISESEKKLKRKLLSSLMWDSWILSDKTTSYDELCNEIDNKFEIKIKKSFINRNYGSINKTIIDRTLFIRCLLTYKTINKLKYLGDNERYDKLSFDYNKVTVSEYVDEITNEGSKFFIEYVIKQTEGHIRIWIGKNNFQNYDRKKLYDYFPIKLFAENVTSRVIDKAIRETVYNICERENIPCENSNIIFDDSESDDRIFGKTIYDTPEYDSVDRNEVIDSETINEARRILNANQNKLIVNEDESDYEIKDSEDMNKLSDKEIKVLGLLLDNKFDDVIKHIDEPIGLIINSINSKMIDIMGDIVIEGTNPPRVIDDYIDDCRKVILENGE